MKIVVRRESVAGNRNAFANCGQDALAPSRQSASFAGVKKAVAALVTWGRLWGLTCGRTLGLACGFLLAAATGAGAQTAPCPGNPEALGTSRILQIDAATTPRVGLKQFPQTLPLQDREVVLTFDDGPMRTTTPKILAALRHDCVLATFFVVGKQAADDPSLVKRTLAEGHSIGTHSYGHPLLSRMSFAAAEAEIDHGIAAVDAALGTAKPQASGPPGAPGQAAPFFRFPGFASTPALLDRLAQRGIVVFGADFWASDWLPMTPQHELDVVTRRLRAAGRGILLLHDTKAETAAMLPSLLTMLRRQGYRIVHVVPSGRRPLVTSEPTTEPPTNPVGGR